MKAGPAAGDLRVPSGQQVSLFSYDEIAAMQQNAAGIGCPRFQRETEERIKEFSTAHGHCQVSARMGNTARILSTSATDFSMSSITVRRPR